jgi:gas vesicle protein
MSEVDKENYKPSLDANFNPSSLDKAPDLSKPSSAFNDATSTGNFDPEEHIDAPRDYSGPEGTDFNDATSTAAFDPDAHKSAADDMQDDTSSALYDALDKGRAMADKAYDSIYKPNSGVTDSDSSSSSFFGWGGNSSTEDRSSFIHDTEYNFGGGDMKESISEMAEDVKEKAEDAKKDMTDLLAENAEEADIMATRMQTSEYE